MIVEKKFLLRNNNNCKQGKAEKDKWKKIKHHRHFFSSLVQTCWKFVQTYKQCIFEKKIALLFSLFVNLFFGWTSHITICMRVNTAKKLNNMYLRACVGEDNPTSGGQIVGLVRFLLLSLSLSSFIYFNVYSWVVVIWKCAFWFIFLSKT